MKSILVVDDDYSMRRGLALLLRGEGYRVFEAATRAETIEILTGQHTIHLAIVDLFLPDTDGMGLAREIIEDYPDMQVLLLTAFVEHERAMAARQYFQDKFLPKESLDKTLVNKVKDILK